jgi:hypothetical protein
MDILFPYGYCTPKNRLAKYRKKFYKDKDIIKIGKLREGGGKAWTMKKDGMQ